MVVDMGLMAPSKTRAKPHDCVSPPNVSQFWVNDTDSESVDDETNCSDDDFKSVDIKARRVAKFEKKEKKKLKLSDISLDSLKQTSGKTRPKKLKAPP